MPDAFVARQPIFNYRLDVVAYELLFRGAGYVTDTPTASSERATATVVLNSLTELELTRFVGGKAAWINVSREFVVGGLARAIPPGLVGLEIFERELFDQQLVDALRDLKRHGYRLALDDFAYRPDSRRLLELFDVFKLDVMKLGRERLREQVQRLTPYRGRLLAEKVATRADHEFCVSAGCDLFQGYFFCRPAVVCTRSIAANRLAFLQVVAALHDPGVELADIERLFARDVALSLRLLRYVNSAFFGLRGDVSSTGQALALLGIDNIRRWATLSVLASIDDKPTELTVTALIRARFCELAGERLGIASRAELFTLGMFSVIDAMMDAPMRDVVASLPFTDGMREALVRHRGKRGELLACVTALETGDYDSARAVVNRAGELYTQSVLWASAATDALLGEPGRGSTCSATSDATASLDTPQVPARGRSQPAPAPGLRSQDAPAPVSRPRTKLGPLRSALARLLVAIRRSRHRVATRARSLNG